MITRLWSRFGWQFSLAVVLTMLSLLSISELPALEWCGWFGVVGGAVALLVMWLGGVNMELPGLMIGFVANVAALFGIFLLITRLRWLLKTAQNQGAV